MDHIVSISDCGRKECSYVLKVYLSNPLYFQDHGCGLGGRLRRRLPRRPGAALVEASSPHRRRGAAGVRPPGAAPSVPPY